MPKISQRATEQSAQHTRKPGHSSFGSAVSARPELTILDRQAPPYGQYMAMCIPYIRVLILATGIQHLKPQHWQIFRRGGYRVRVKFSWAFLLEARFTVSVCSGGFLDRHISASLPIHNISKEATYGRVQRARMQ